MQQSFRCPCTVLSKKLVKHTVFQLHTPQFSKLWRHHNEPGLCPCICIAGCIHLLVSRRFTFFLPSNGMTYIDAWICSLFFWSMQPVFHDGMKEWSCCGAKSHDFGLFMDIKGYVILQDTFLHKNVFRHMSHEQFLSGKDQSHQIHLIKQRDAQFGRADWQQIRMFIWDVYIYRFIYTRCLYECHAVVWRFERHTLQHRLMTFTFTSFLRSWILWYIHSVIGRSIPSRDDCSGSCPSSHQTFLTQSCCICSGSSKCARLRVDPTQRFQPPCTCAITLVTIASWSLERKASNVWNHPKYQPLVQHFFPYKVAIGGRPPWAIHIDRGANFLPPGALRVRSLRRRKLFNSAASAFLPREVAMNGSVCPVLLTCNCSKSAWCGPGAGQMRVWISHSREAWEASPKPQRACSSPHPHHPRSTCKRPGRSRQSLMPSLQPRIFLLGPSGTCGREGYVRNTCWGIRTIHVRRAIFWLLGCCTVGIGLVQMSLFWRRMDMRALPCLGIVESKVVVFEQLLSDADNLVGDVTCIYKLNGRFKLTHLCRLFWTHSSWAINVLGKTWMYPIEHRMCVVSLDVKVFYYYMAHRTCINHTWQLTWMCYGCDIVVAGFMTQSPPIKPSPKEVKQVTIESRVEFAMCWDVVVTYSSSFIP